jgi:WhiB family redox-sensing transcriptional regulator
MTTVAAPTGRVTTPAALTSRNWRSYAACFGEDPELFFPLGLSGAALDQEDEAKAVCARCPAIAWCRRWALETGQQAGVWGGLSEWERVSRSGRREEEYRTSRDGTPAWEVIVATRSSEYEQLAADGLSAWEISRRMRTTIRTINRVREALAQAQGEGVKAA